MFSIKVPGTGVDRGTDFGEYVAGASDLGH